MKIFDETVYLIVVSLCGRILILSVKLIVKLIIINTNNLNESTSDFLNS